MSDDEGWDDDDLDTVMQAAATPAGPSTSTALYSGNHSLSTASSSSSSSPGPAASASKKKKAQGLRKVSKTSSAAKKRISTPKMQERQARGTNVMSSDDDSSDQNFDPNYNPYENAETWEAKQRRRLAAMILDNPELLMMHAQARSDSIPGIRHHFTKILCGYQEPENEYPFAKSFQDEKERNARPAKKWFQNPNITQQTGGGAAGGV